MMMFGWNENTRIFDDGGGGGVLQDDGGNCHAAAVASAVETDSYLQVFDDYCWTYYDGCYYREYRTAVVVASVVVGLMILLQKNNCPSSRRHSQRKEV